jgi:outer membrane protein assembly factor BamD (BamD/ComL family)
MTRTAAAAAVVSLACATVVRAQEPTTQPPAAEFRDGRWQPVAPPQPAVPPADPELDHVQQLLDHNDGDAAFAVAVQWIKGHDKVAPQRDRALYLIAQALYRTDDWVRAYYYLDELMDEYPASPLYSAALEVQFHIADGFLDGHKIRALGLPILPATDEAVEMLYRIQQRAPGSPLAERALLRTADFYYANGDYDLAQDAYDFYAKQYPRSDHVPQVKLRAAFAALARFRGPRFDATPMLDARTKLADFAVAYPALAAEENVPGILAKIDDELALKLYLTADFYRRTGATDGAVYMYRYQLLTYPNGPHAADARAALAAMPAWALAQPSPQAGQSYAPPASPLPRVPLP